VCAITLLYAATRRRCRSLPRRPHEQPAFNFSLEATIGVCVLLPTFDFNFRIPATAILLVVSLVLAGLNIEIHRALSNTTHSINPLRRAKIVAAMPTPSTQT